MMDRLQRLASRSRFDDSDGFTLIELLIVVVIIGILAAIAIPQFSSTKESAYDSTARSDLRNLTTTQESHFADFQTYASNIAFDQSSTPSSNTVVFNASSGLDQNIQIDAADNQGFTASAQHPSSDNCFAVRVGSGGDGGDQGSGEVTNGDNIGASGCPIVGDGG